MKSSKLKLASIILAVVLCLLVLSAPAGAVVQPNSDFYVLDNENVLSAETERYIIDRNLNLVSNCKGAQVCVVVTDSTNGQDIEEYATELFNAWGIGSKTEDNGVLILFLTDDDNYWIMPGIGLERVLTERVLRQIIDDDCEPSFARKDYDSAAKATFIAINRVVCNYYSQDPNGSGDSDNFPNNNGNNYYPDDHPGYNSGSSCLSCGSREHLTWFSVKRGGILCAECRNEAPDAVELNESTVYTMQYVILARIEKLYTFSVSGQVLEELTRLLRSYFGVYVGHAFKSLKILEDAEKVEIMFLK